MVTNTTKHSKQRGKERLGLPKNATDRIAQKAFEQGIKHGETSGGLRRFLDSLWLSQKNCNNMRIYNRSVFMFAGNVLVTILNVPKEYHKQIDKIKDRKEVNV